MTESQIRLYHAITNIDDDIIEEAQISAEKRKVSFVRYFAIAASFCVIAAGAILLFAQHKLPVNPPQNEDIQPSMTQAVQPTQDVIDSTSIAPDYSAINYSNIALPSAQVDAFLMEQYAGVSIDIAPFDEAFLSECCGVLEGTVTRIYPKHYTYDFYDDKFGETELYHSYADTVVYELEIEKVWYGEAFAEGSEILIEDQFFFPDSLFSLMVGRSYVLPIYREGDTVRTIATKEVASGDLSRDSVYSTKYPFHPQITRTEDGCYLVTTDWPSLTAAPCRVVNMEAETEYEGFFKDKFRLVYEEDFSVRLMSLIHMQLEASVN